MAMGQHEPEPRSSGESGAHEERQTWVERYLGDGWQEVEPGIYRFVGQSDPPAAEPPLPEQAATPEDELGDALDPTKTSKTSPPPARRSGRWRVRR